MGVSRRACLLAAAGSLMPLAAWAEGYPVRPIHLVVPYEAGGGVDLVARLIGDRLGAALGQAVVIDNKPGAGSNIGAGFVARAAADGYTLLMASPANAINVTLYKKMPYDTVRDLVPIVLIGQVPSVLIVNADLPVKTLADFIALAKAKPGVLTFGSGGNGASEHLAGALFMSQAGVAMQHIPYRGGSAAVNDLIGGQISSVIINSLAVLPFIKSGQVRALAVASKQRSPALPEVPTFAEAGLPGYEISVWWGLMAPAGTPQPIIERLNEVVDAALATPEFKQRLAEMGAQVDGGSPAQFGAFLEEEIKRWGEAVRLSGAHVG